MTIFLNNFFQKNYSCEEKCIKTLTCGHPCPRKCTDFCEDFCNSMSNSPNSSDIRRINNVFLGLLANANLPIYLPAIYSHLRTQSIRSARRSDHAFIKKKIRLLELVKIMYQAVQNSSKTSASYFTHLTETFNARLQLFADFILNCKECEQQRHDITAEIIILKLMARAIIKANALPLDANGREYLNDAFAVAHPSRRAGESAPIKFSRLVCEACKHKSNDNKICAIM